MKDQKKKLRGQATIHSKLAEDFVMLTENENHIISTEYDLNFDEEEEDVGVAKTLTNNEGIKAFLKLEKRMKDMDQAYLKGQSRQVDNLDKSKVDKKSNKREKKHKKKKNKKRRDSSTE